MSASALSERTERILSSCKADVQVSADSAVELAELMLREAIAIRNSDEKKIQSELARMMQDPSGKVFTTYMADQCFRSRDHRRVANQLCYLIDRFGVPQYLSWEKRVGLHAFRWLAKGAPRLFVPLAAGLLRREMSRVILPGEDEKLGSHMNKRRSQSVRVNLNHLGEAILGEGEAKRRLKIYLDDLAKPEVDYISVKVSTIYSQINLLAWNETLDALAEPLRLLYRAAGKGKFVNLDMEEYKDLHLTMELFQKVLDEPEFHDTEAGIVLQAYLPDSYELQRKLTEWAEKRVTSGGAPIKIRIVKGANLALEQVDASLHGWEQTPYLTKSGVDANFKRMVAYGCEHAKAAHLGIGSHNLFDIAYAMLLRAKYGVEQWVCFEMLEGMADHIRRVVQNLSGDMLLYCPAAKEHEFQNAVAYLIRRLDENTAPENFLHDSFGMEPGSPEWIQQKTRFLQAYSEMKTVQSTPQRLQDRNQAPHHLNPDEPFANEADTDWSLPQNRKWMEEILEASREKTYGGDGEGIGFDPSRPGLELYRYPLLDEGEVESVLETAAKAEVLSVEDRCTLLVEIAKKLREHRGELIALMVADGGKTAPEADVEVSEAIDFAEYYWRNYGEHIAWKGITWSPKGVILVTPPWNFPLAIPVGSVVSALMTGNKVIFKPARETVLIARRTAELMWEAGCPKELLQLVTCEDNPVGSKLVKDSRVNGVILTGATDTATLFQTMRPDLHLMAETGGKNALIVTDLADRDLAILDAVQSAFGHSGQKCSACSLLILEKGVYNDLDFRRQLADAAESLKVGSAWEFATKINPIILPPGEKLEKGLTQLEEGEEWLLEPRRLADNLWSPAIRWGVRRESYSHRTELFGPHLSVMCAEDLNDAISIANDTPYGLTSGIHTLDDREKDIWLDGIQAGNLYINRGITGAIVRRQPFGGCKSSSFGRGSKAGGPNYLSQLMDAVETESPVERKEVPESVQILQRLIREDEQALWDSSVGNYAYWMEKEFSVDHDPSQVTGQDNIFRYVPHDHVVLRVQSGDSHLDIYRFCAAALIAGTFVELSCQTDEFPFLREEGHWTQLPDIQVICEEEEMLQLRIKLGAIERLRYLSTPPQEIRERVAGTCCRLTVAPIAEHGRLELLHYLREVSISHSYHRYGNLGDREGER